MYIQCNNDCTHSLRHITCRTGDYTGDMQKSLRTAIERNPSNVEAYFMLAKLKRIQAEPLSLSNLNHNGLHDKETGGVIKVT